MHLGHVADAIERDLDVRRSRGRGRSAVFVSALRRPEGAARAPGERVALAQRVEDLPVDAPRGVRAERGATVAAIAAGSLYEAHKAPGDEVLAVGATAARIDGTGGDRSCELKVRDDAVISNNKCRISHDAPPLRRGPYVGLHSVSIAD